MGAATKYVTRKHRGAYAVFQKGAERPEMTGLTYAEAQAWKDHYNAEAERHGRT